MSTIITIFKKSSFNFRKWHVILNVIEKEETCRTVKKIFVTCGSFCWLILIFIPLEYFSYSREDCREKLRFFHSVPHLGYYYYLWHMIIIPKFVVQFKAHFFRQSRLDDDDVPIGRALSSAHSTITFFCQTFTCFSTTLDISVRIQTPELLTFIHWRLLKKSTWTTIFHKE